MVMASSKSLKDFEAEIPPGQGILGASLGLVFLFRLSVLAMVVACASRVSRGMVHFPVVAILIDEDEILDMVIQHASQHLYVVNSSREEEMSEIKLLVDSDITLEMAQK
ncbi:hypothetical protein Tco_0340863 [Tanacetum coccineum]